MMKKTYPLILLLVVLFTLGLGIRLYDLGDPPLDFHPTRQLRNAIVARGIYYDLQTNADPTTRSLAASLHDTIGIYEPPIIETMTALGYRLAGGENLAIPRVINSLLWLVGGVVLFLLARAMTSTAGAVFALGYYLFLPFGIQASRSFQPDPLMTVGIILTMYGLYRWSQTQSWKWAVLAGLFGGLAVLIKLPAVYLVAAAALASVLSVLGIKNAWRRPQVWVMAGLMIIPALYFYWLRDPGSSTDYFLGWTVSLSHLLTDPGFYIRWMSFLSYLMSLSLIFLGLVGVIISKARPRAILLSLWIGYFLYGLTLPYQMYTHNYYHIQLIPVLALSLAPVADLLFEKLSQQKRIWKIVLAGVALIAVFYPLWVAHSVQASKDYRHEPAYWQDLGAVVPDDGAVIALTQDYGFRLMYYGWTKVSLWPTQIERDLSEIRGAEGGDFESEFSDRVAGKSYFLVTAPSQLDKQPSLKEQLQENYPIVSQGDGYILFDLEP
jgi:hypothetical protein